MPLDLRRSKRVTVRLLIGDCRDLLPTLPANSVHCVVTSPPYWGLRDYGTAKWEGGDATCEHRGRDVRTALTGGEKQQSKRGSIGVTSGDCVCGAVRIDSQLGLEKTPDEYVAKMVAVFREVRRVLRDDGTLWLNLGDSYASEGGAHGGRKDNQRGVGAKRTHDAGAGDQLARRAPNGIKAKDLCGIPWRVAFALQADCWYLRSDIIWHKPNPMPESVTDRPTKAHEYLFLLTKSASYFYDADAIAEESTYSGTVTFGGPAKLARAAVNGALPTGNEATTARRDNYPTRNRRSVWTVATRPYKGAHFATFPPKLIEPCILAGTSPQACEHCAAPWERVTERIGAEVMSPRSQYGNGAGRNDGGRSQLVGASSSTLGWRPTCDCADNTGAGRCVVLDPFGGAGTTGLVADRLGRDAILIELNKEYTELGTDRITDDAPLFANVHVGNGNGNGHA